MARSVFYYHLKALQRGDKHAQLKSEIEAIFHEHKGRYGYRRITSELKNRGYIVNHKTIQRFMAHLGLKCQTRVIRYRSYKGNVGKVASNILNRNFVAKQPNKKWVTDVTQITIAQTKLYLSPIIDLYNGEVVSYNISNSPNLAQVYDMLDKAFVKVTNTKGIILHSDQGWQYQHRGYQRRLEAHGIIQSMSRKGNCLDNAVAENFFGIMKSELLYAQNFNDSEHFIAELQEYIEYYNNVRIKSRLQGMSPVQYRNSILKA